MKTLYTVIFTTLLLLPLSAFGEGIVTLNSTEKSKSSWLSATQSTSRSSLGQTRANENSSLSVAEFGRELEYNSFFDPYPGWYKSHKIGPRSDLTYGLRGKKRSLIYIKITF